MVYMEITQSERFLLGLGRNEPIPSGGTTFELISFSGFGADSTKSWTNRPDSLKVSFLNEFGIEFFPGSLNVRLVSGKPWVPVDVNDMKAVKLGVFAESYITPLIIEETCIAIVSAVNVRGFDPATSERLVPDLWINKDDTLAHNVEMYAIYSTVDIRERIGLPKEDDGTVINVRLLSGNLLK